MAMKRTLFILVAALVTVCAAGQELIIIHFNDTHSHIDPERAGTYMGRGGVIEQAAYIDSVRSDAGKRNVLLVHAGDFSQGSSYFTELHGDMEIDVMNAMKFDVITLGNHEFDNGITELSRRLADLDADVVCANYDFTGTVLEDRVKPYTIIRRAGKKIGIIGILTDVSKVVDVSIIGGLEYQEPAPVVNEYAAYLRNDRKCDLVLCLSHLGYVEDKELAAMISNVDFIIGGHSHTLLDRIHYVEGTDGRKIGIVQNWKWGYNIASLKIRY